MTRQMMKQHPKSPCQSDSKSNARSVSTGQSCFESCSVSGSGPISVYLMFMIYLATVNIINSDPKMCDDVIIFSRLRSEVFSNHHICFIYWVVSVIIHLNCLLQVLNHKVFILFQGLFLWFNQLPLSIKVWNLWFKFFWNDIFIVSLVLFS